MFTTVYIFYSFNSIHLKIIHNFCVKENVSMKTGQFLVDSDDNSVTRTLDQYKSLFAQAGLRIALQMKQPRWPSHLFPVLMFALVPISS